MSKKSLDYNDYYKDFVQRLKDAKKNKILSGVEVLNWLLVIGIGIIIIVLFIEKKDEVLKYSLIVISLGIILKIGLLIYFYYNSYANDTIKKDISILSERCNPKVELSTASIQQTTDTNPNTNKTIDLCVRDYYWMGIHRPYMSTETLEDINMLETNLQKNFRAMSLEVKNSNNELTIGNTLKIDDVFKKIKTVYKANLPTILYLQISYGNISYYHEELYNKIMKHFGDKLLFLQQGFVGMGGIYSLPSVPIKDTVGKYIILVDCDYPTNSFNFNSIINGATTKNRQYIKKFNYTNSDVRNGIKYNNNTKNLIEHNKEYMSIVVPIENTQMNAQDCFQNGMQIILMDMLNYKGFSNNYTNISLKKWMSENKSLVLKDKKLRYFPPKKIEIKSQNKDLSFASRKNIVGDPNNPYTTFMT